MVAAAVLVASVFASPMTAAAQQGDAAEGESVFKKCSACHRVGEGARNMTGPVLNNVIGRPAGSAEGYAYSELNKSAGSAGLVWTEELVFEYLVDPNAFLRKFVTDKGNAGAASGATKMVFKLEDETDRRNVIAYLKKFSEKK
jgi:cytochrome c